MSENVANRISEEDGLLVVCMAESQIGSELQKLKQIIIEKAAQHGHDIEILVDVSKVKTSDKDADRVARTFFQNLPFRHMAVYGGSRAVNVGIKLVLNLFISMGAGEVKLFKTENKARMWLKSTD